LEVADLHPLGSSVLALDPRQLTPACVAELQELAARRGFVRFRRLENITVADLLRISQSFGGREVVSRHVAHAQSPDDGILRLSNQAARGVVGVGPQWHSDGSTEARVFSHLLFHAQQMPASGGETDFADLAAAYEALPPDLQERWSRLASVNAYSGAVHPLVHRHPITGRKAQACSFSTWARRGRWCPGRGMAQARSARLRPRLSPQWPPAPRFLRAAQL
ncbi:unnamed protein product, partial [Symbiodinium natans]